MDNQKVLDDLKQIVKNKGLKYTKQREIILETILNSDKHLTAEELHNQINQEQPDAKIGIATVYRTLAFLEDENLVSSIAMDKDGKKFEPNTKKHHDHLICVKCNKIIEFLDEEIEKKQEQVAQDNGFKLLNHTMYLYGVCKDCQD